MQDACTLYGLCCGPRTSLVFSSHLDRKDASCMYQDAFIVAGCSSNSNGMHWTQVYLFFFLMIEINYVNRDAFCWAVKSAMRVTRKRSNVKKAVRICKVVVAPTIKWVLNDNLCLLYAIWEMCTAVQKNILTVSQCLNVTNVKYE